MPYLVAAVVLVGLLCLFDLVLTLGVIRRLREHTEKLAALDGPRDDTVMPAGSLVRPFTAATTTGGEVSRDTLRGPTLVGFFTPGCTPCLERVPEFVAYARDFPGAVVAVAVGDATETAGLVGSLRDVADVVTEPQDGPVQSAFGVGGYPALCLVDGAGLVLAGGTTMRDLPAPSPV
jgi:thiol-disulfide isomerase/thioredoxin